MKRCSRGSIQLRASRRPQLSAAMFRWGQTRQSDSVRSSLRRAEESKSVRNCVIMDTAVLRGIKNAPLLLGDNVLVGPRAHLTGCTIEDDVFLATGATIFNGAHIGRRSEVRINGIVHIRTRLPAGSTVPLNWIAVGDPANI